MIAVMRFGMEAISSWQYPSVISEHHTSLMHWMRFAVVGCFAATLSLSIFHTFSIGWQSGEFPGHSRTSIPFDRIANLWPVSTCDTVLRPAWIYPCCVCPCAFPTCFVRLPGTAVHSLSYFSEETICMPALLMRWPPYHLAWTLDNNSQLGQRSGC